MMVSGALVACIDDKFPADIGKIYRALPVEGEFYTVRDLRPGHGLTGKEEIQITVEELINDPLVPNGIEVGFNAERFAPLQTLPDEELEAQFGSGATEEKHEPELVPLHQ